MFINNSKGFTLIEMLAGIGIFILLIGSITAFFISSTQNQTIIFNQLDTQGEVRKVIQDFVGEIRSATYSSIGSYPLLEASSSEIIFYTNIDADNLRERVRYFLVTTTLKKGIIKPSGYPLMYNTSSESITDVIHSVVQTSSTIFTYYDANYTGVEPPLVQPVNPSAVRVVGIQIFIDKNPSSSPNVFGFQAKANIRTIKDN